MNVFNSTRTILKSLLDMRSLMITVGSLTLSAIVVGHAFVQKKQFYPAVIYLTKSSPSMAVLYLQAFIMVYLLGKIMRRIFFGQLRAAEMEHLVERSWYAVTETCLAFTVFRDDFSSRFVAMFTILLFLKCFHWLAEDRIDYMERSPIISWKFHIRAAGLISFLSLVDTYFIMHAYSSTIQKGASVQLVFGFEYMILLMTVLAILLRYILHTIDSRSEHPWEHKAMYMLYVDLIVGLVRLGLYLIFLVLMVRVHTFPLFIIRPVYVSVRAFKKAVQDVVLSRRAIRYMNTVFPNATAADLEATDNVCIICREEMSGTNTTPAPLPAPAAAPQPQHHAPAKRLPCGHIFHSTCLRSWFQRQQTCPTCRMDILRVAQAAPAAGGAANGVPAAAGINVAAGVGAGAAGQPGAQQMFIGAPPGFANWLLQQAGIGGAPPPPPPAPLTGSQPPWGSVILGQGMPQMPTDPATFANMTPEELARMEGHERAAIEARLATLQQIKTLLDAAVVQMAGYMAAVQTSGPSPFAVPPSTFAPSTSATAASTSDNHRASNNGDLNSSTDVEVKPVSSNIETLTSVGNGGAGAEGTDDEREVVRQRRLQKFSSQTSSENAPKTPATGDPSASQDSQEKDEPDKKVD